jgi:hypothetical protein
MRYSMSKTLALLITGFMTLAGSASIGLAADTNAAGDDVVSFSREDAVLSRIDLEVNRGTYGTNTVASEQSLASSAQNNSLNVQGDLTNGNISVGDKFGGFGSYVMNTGNNTSINSAVSVNVQLMSSP